MAPPPVSLPEKPTLLISRPDRIGDVVISSSVIPFLRAAYPSARIYFLIHSSMHGLFQGVSELDSLLALPPEKETSASQVQSLTQTFKNLQADAIIHLHPNDIVYQAASMAKIPLKIGWKRKCCDRDLTHGLPLKKHLGRKHEALYGFDLLSFLGIPAPAMPVYHLGIGADVDCSKHLPWSITTPYAVINPTSARDVRRWPREHFAEISRWLREKQGLKIVSIGGSASDPACQAFAEVSAGQEIARLEGKLSLAELVHLLQHSKLLVTCDTGPAHLAAAVGCPQVVIFGRTEPAYGPQRWAPLSPKTMIVAANIQKKLFETRRTFWKRGFQSITVQRVQQAIQTAFAIKEKC